MKKRAFITTLALGALILAAPLALAQPGPGGLTGTRGPGARLERMQERLGLTDAQVTQLEALKADHRAQTASTREQLDALRQQMHQVLGAPAVNEAQALALHNRMQTIKQQLSDARFKQRLSMMQVLTQDQRVRMLERRGMRGKGWKHGKWGHRRGGRGL